MKSYPVGLAFVVTIPFLDLNGDPVSPTGLFARVVNEDGTVLDTFTPAVVEGDTDVELDIPATCNAAPGARSVELDMTVEGGVITTTVNYLVVAPVVLQLFENSFQTSLQALALSSEMVNLVGWDGAGAADRSKALAEAFFRLTTIGYRAQRAEDLDTQNYIPDTDLVIKPRSWPYMTIERWKALPARFRKALCKAQILEANEILRGDPVEGKRRQGILSESIGESSMMFRSGKPLDLGISPAALQALSGFIEYRIATTRS